MVHSDLSRISVENSLSHSAEYFLRGESLSAYLISDTEKICKTERDGRRVTRFPSEKKLSHSAENFCRGTPLCCVSELFQ